MKTLGERIKIALDAKKANKSSLAAACNVTPGAVTLWCKGEAKMGAATAYRAAEFLGVDFMWLTEGIGSMSPSNVTPADLPQRTVPIVSWVQAGDFAEAIDLLAPGEGERVMVTVPVRAHTFALRVVGDSMEPRFTAGMIIVVEPELDPLPGDFVIAKNGDDEATFKQLVKDGGVYYLRPLNTQYPMLPLGTGRIIGVVREAVSRFR